MHPRRSVLRRVAVLRRAGAVATAATMAAAVTVTAATGTAAGAAPAAESGSAPVADATPQLLTAPAASAIADSYLVTLRDTAVGRTDVGRAAADLADRYGGAVGYRYTSALRGFSVRMSATAARRLAADPAVALVEQNRAVYLDDTQLNPPSWGIDRIDQLDLPLDNSYTYPTGAGDGVRIYVVDTGIRLTHQDFGGRAVSGVDLVDGGSADDCHGHGSHVAGTAGGTGYGVAKLATLVAVRVFDCGGFGDLARAVAGVDWITANAVLPAVANLSLGYQASSDTAGTMQTAVVNSIAAGITYVVSAGNDNGDACNKTPARTPAAITVAASQADDGTWPSSNEGPCVDLFAPGLNVISAGHASDTAEVWRSGTSMAAPHVAGAAALILDAHPTWTPQQVRDEIVAEATPDTLNWVTSDTVNLLLHVGA